MRITAILYVLKQSFDQTNLLLFLHWFWLFIIYRTTVQPIKVFLIYFIIYSSSIVLWSFSYNNCVVDCWHICFNWSDQSSLILKLVLGCDWNFMWAESKPYIWICLPRRFVEGCGENFSIQLVALLDLKYLSSYLFKTCFVNCWLVRITFIGSEFIYPKTCPWVWLKILSGMYPNQTYGFASIAVLWKVVARMPFFVIEPVTINKLIVFKDVPQNIQFCICIGKCWLKGHQRPLG